MKREKLNKCYTPRKPGSLVKEICIVKINYDLLELKCVLLYILTPDARIHNVIKYHNI